MQIEIFNVEHGQCSVVTLPNGKKIMIDTGHNTNQLWRPSVHFSGQQIEELVLSNFDEDHASDFANVMDKCNLRYITLNNSVTPTVLREMKKANGMGNGIQAVYNWWNQVSGSASTNGPDYGEADISHFWNAYGSPHSDENNLSVASFVEWNGFVILFTGDLEEDGWQSLLLREDFRKKLQRVSVLMASHHGRLNGCCDNIFNCNGQRLCYPRCVIISDGGIEHSTQETRDWYKNRTQGCKTTESKDRWVLSTCNDGNIKIKVGPNGRWSIETNYIPAARKTLLTSSFR